MNRKAIGIEQVLATFSSHIEQRYHMPEQYMNEIERMLNSKKNKNDSSGYCETLERNLVFLYFYVEELKSLIEIMLDRVDDDSEFLKIDPGLIIMDIEEQLREQTERKHREIFSEDPDSVFGESKDVDLDSSYTEKLEFHYSYLMAARSFSIDFINILYAAQREYRIENSSFEKVWSYIDMTVNYYIGNVAVQEKQTEE